MQARRSGVLSTISAPSASASAAPLAAAPKAAAPAGASAASRARAFASRAVAAARQATKSSAVSGKLLLLLRNVADSCTFVTLVTAYMQIDAGTAGALLFVASCSNDLNTTCMQHMGDTHLQCQ